MAENFVETKTRQASSASNQRQTKPDYYSLVFWHLRVFRIDFQYILQLICGKFRPATTTSCIEHKQLSTCVKDTVRTKGRAAYKAQVLQHRMYTVSHLIKQAVWENS
jgi:hypothetical protein